MKRKPWSEANVLFVALAVLLTAGCHTMGTQGMPPAENIDAGEAKHITVARVNGADISQHSLNGMVSRMTAINRGRSLSEPEKETKKKALDQLIFQELSYQEALRQGLSVKNTEIESSISALVGHRTEDLDAFLAKQNMTVEELRAEIKRRILLQRIYAREVIEKISISDDDVRKEYERGKNEYIAPEKMAVVDVAVSPKLDEQASMKKAAEIIAAINAEKGKNPRNLPHDDAFTVQERKLVKEQEPALWDPARNLKPGELSGPVRAGSAVHVLQLIEYSPERQLSYEEVQGSLAERMKLVAQAVRFGEWEQELKKGAQIEILDSFEPEHKKP